MGAVAQPSATAAILLFASPLPALSGLGPLMYMHLYSLLYTKIKEPVREGKIILYKAVKYPFQLPSDTELC